MKTVPCPTCRAPASWENNSYRPFCSERCRLLDLGKWLAEDYRIPAAPEDDPDDVSDDAENP